MNSSQTADEAWRTGNHAKRSVGYVELSRSGLVTIRVGEGASDRVLSFSEANESGEVWRKLRGFAFGAAAMLFGAVISVAGLLIKRRCPKGSK